MTMVTTEVGRRKRAKAGCRAQIIDAGIRLFGERNTDAVSVDEIAAAADVGKGTIYNYLRTKEDIVVAFVADFERKVRAVLRDLDTADRPLAETLTEFIRLQFQMKAPHYRFVRVFFAQMFLHISRGKTVSMRPFAAGRESRRSARGRPAARRAADRAAARALPRNDSRTLLRVMD